MKNKCGFVETGEYDTGGVPIMNWKCYCNTTVCQEVMRRQVIFNKLFSKRI